MLGIYLDEFVSVLVEDMPKSIALILTKPLTNFTRIQCYICVSVLTIIAEASVTHVSCYRLTLAS